MATVTFENGQSVDFEGTPSPQDIEEVASKLNIQSQSSLPIQEEHGAGLSGFGGKFVSGILKTPARLATNLINAGQLAVGQKPTTPFSGKFLGDVQPVGMANGGGFSGANLKDALGTGLETGSYLVGGGEAKAGLQSLKEGGLALKPLLRTAWQGTKSGATVGALGGTGSELQNPDATVGSTLIQGGVGGLVGGITGGLLGAGGNLIEKTGILNKLHPEAKTNAIIQNRANELSKLDNYSTISKVVQKNKDRGIDVKGIVANTDLLHGAVDKTGTITTKGEGNAIDQVQQFIKPQEAVIAKNLQKEGISLSPEKVKAKLVSQIENSGISGKARTQALNNVDAEIVGYRLNDKGQIPLEELHNAKIDKYNGINFMTDPEKQKYDKSIAKGLKELVENNTKSVDVKTLNNELSKHYAVIDYLNKLDGKKVEGGKLGKYFAQTIGAIVGGHFGPLGAIVGGHFGPLGAIVGAETAGGLKGVGMAKTFNGKIGKNLEQSQTMKEALIRGNAPQLQLPSPKPGAYRSEIRTSNTIPVAPKGSPIELTGKIGIGSYSNSLGNRQTAQTMTINPIKKGIKPTIPQESKISKQIKAIKKK